ncbi:MAG: hypothetical protein ACXADL_03895 [Candidatus Thorarchaeota archaeon]|jgi:hypothetical protein
MERIRETYILAFILGFIPFTLLLFVNSWDFGSLLNSSLMTSLFTVSGTIMKFLSGIGIMLTYAALCSIVFNVMSDAMKRSTSRAKAVKVILVLPLIVISFYGGYKLLGAFLYSQTLGFVEILISLYGIWSLMISIYILPAVRGLFRPDYRQSTSDKIRGKVDDFGFSLWRGYQTKIRGDYGKVHAKEFERYGERMYRVRAQLSGFLLLPIGLILSVFPPIAAVLVVLWIRSFDLKRNPLKVTERVFLTIAVICVLLLSTWVFLVFNLSTARIFFDGFYGVGVIISILILIFIITFS